MEPATKRSYRLPLIVSVILHIALIITLSLQVVSAGGSQHKPTQASTKPVPVKATVTSQAAVDAAITRIQKRESAKKEQALAELKRIQQQTARSKRRQAQEQKRLAAIRAKQKAIAKKAKAQALAVKKLKLEQAKREAARKKALAAQKEQARLATIKKQQQQAALQKQRQALADKLMAQQLQTEQQQIKQDEYSAQLASAIAEYSDKISDAIGSYWNKPEVTSQKIKAVLMLDLGPGGVVLGVRLAKSSGNAVWDRQAMAAAHKASPLPVPKDPRLFDKFRHLRLTVSPS